MSQSPPEPPRLRLLSKPIPSPDKRTPFPSPLCEPSESSSAADRRIALALHRAHTAVDCVLSVTPTLGHSRSLEEIEDLVRQHGWSRAFRTLKALGLVKEQTLGHVIARWGRQAGGASALTSAIRAGLRAAASPAPSQTA
jgi:hypothetical protein